MKKVYCVRHQKTHTNDGGWRFTSWDTEKGTITGWGCADIHYPEMVPQRIKDERVTYANDQLQSHRGGELSREFLEAYPNQAKKMLRAGAISKEEVKKAKYVWNKDVKGVTKKIDAEALITS